MEYLFHEEAAGGGASQFFGILQRTDFRTRAGTAGRVYLGNGDGIQPGGGAVHERRDFLCDWPIGTDGGGAVGSAGLERICGCAEQGEDVSGDDVRVLWSGNTVGGEGQWLSRSHIRNESLW